MSNLFGRKVKVIFKGAIVEDLAVEFTVEKSLVGYPNKARIVIYNLKESRRESLKEEGKEIELHAGYNTPILLFKGDIVNVIHQYIKPDWVSTLYCLDSITAINNATINKTMPAGSTTSQIFDELTKQMDGVTKGVTQGLQKCLNGKQSLLRSLQLTGNVKDWLKKISEQCGFDYSINEGIIETTEKNKPLTDLPPVIINHKSGMIGSPERTDVGVTVKNLLLPDLKLGRRFQIKSISETINVGNLYFRKVPPIRNGGIYRIDKLIHTGETHGDAWETQIHGRVF